MGLKEKADELAGALKSTAEFAELKRAKAVINSDHSLRVWIDAFNNKQKQLQSGRLSHEEAEAKAVELEKMFKSMTGIAEINSYLKAAGMFNKVLGDVIKSINESLESEL